MKNEGETVLAVAVKAALAVAPLVTTTCTGPAARLGGVSTLICLALM